MNVAFSQRFSRSERQKRQTPHVEAIQPTPTQSPALNCSTPEPAATTFARAEDPSPHELLENLGHEIAGQIRATDEGVEQINRYLTAATNFHQQMFYAVGNHECLTITSLNCLDSNLGGLPNSLRYRGRSSGWPWWTIAW